MPVGNLQLLYIVVNVIKKCCNFNPDSGYILYNVVTCWYEMECLKAR